MVRRGIPHDDSYHDIEKVLNFDTNCTQLSD